MRLFFVTSDSERFRQFKYLVPYEVSSVDIPRNLHSVCMEFRASTMLFVEDITGCSDPMLVFDCEHLEINCLNGFPGENFAALVDIGVENIDLILGARERGATHRTVLHIVFKHNAQHKFAVEGRVNGEIRKRFFKTGIASPEDIFVPENYDTSFREMRFRERLVTNSLGIATKRFIDFIEGSGYGRHLRRVSRRP